MAFGISGSDTRTDMIGADVVVTWINDDGPNAIDYYLATRQQVCTYILYLLGDYFAVAKVQGRTRGVS